MPEVRYRAADARAEIKYAIRTKIVIMYEIAKHLDLIFREILWRLARNSDICTVLLLILVSYAVELGRFHATIPPVYEQAIQDVWPCK